MAGILIFCLQETRLLTRNAAVLLHVHPTRLPPDSKLQLAYYSRSSSFRYNVNTREHRVGNIKCRRDRPPGC